jgi:hypothetical protein
MAVNKVIMNTTEGERVLMDLTEDNVSSEKVFDGVTFHGADGNVKTGTFTISSELNEQDSVISQIRTALHGKAAGGGASTPTQEKTVDITKNGSVEITPDEGYALSKVTANVNVSGSSGDSDLPEGYRRCDYIQFTGSQWIDTGIVGNQNTQVNTCFTWENSTQRHLFGCASSDNTKSITSYMNGSWRFGNKSTSKSFSTKNPMLPYGALVNSTTISTTNSVTSISGVNDFETVGSLLLGGCRDADGTQPSVGITGKVFYFTLWQGVELVRKLIPVTDGNGVYRFWDLISKAFFDSITTTPLEGGNL